MKRLMLLVLVMCALTLSALTPVPVYAFDDKPATFLVLDNSGNVTGSVYRSWNQMVKMNYHFPYYKLTEDNTEATQLAAEIVNRNGGKVDYAVMKDLAEKVKAEALVLVRVYEMRTYTVYGSPFRIDPGELYTRTIAYADLYAYNQNGDKFSKKAVRENELNDMGSSDAPADIIKWKLGNMLNKMEGRAPLE